MIKCVIIEDDFASAIDMKVKLEAHGYDVFDIIEDVDDLNDLDRLRKADIIISDVKLGDNLYAFDILSQHNSLPPIIFFSSHEDSDLYEKSSKLSPHVYLIKPVSGLSIHSAIQGALKNREKYVDKDIKIVDGSIFVRSQGKLVNINPEKILYIQSEGNYCYIYMADKKIVIRSSIKKILGIMNKSYLVQIHRAFIVNLPKVTTLDITNDEVQIGTKTIPVGRTYKKYVKQALER